MASPGTNNPKPHAVCVPWPAQGHINPMMKLARLLHHRGFHITFVHTEYNYRRLLRTHGCGGDTLASLPSFRIETIPDGLPPEDADVTQDIPALTISMDKDCATPFKRLLERLKNENKVPPVTCIVSDVVMPFTLDVSEEMGILNVQFWTASAAGFLGYALYTPLMEAGLVPMKDSSCLTNGYLDKVIEWAPEPFKGICLKDIPSFIRTTDPNDIMFNYMRSSFQKSQRAAAIIFNTFDALEGQFLSTLAPSFPPFYTCGPLYLLHEQIRDEDETLSMIKSNMWKEDDSCIYWLNSKEPESVVYVNFGCITTMTSHHLVEFAWGLAHSGKNFLWIIRPDLVSGENAILPSEFVTNTKDRSLLASWCDQEKVLTHHAIGGFLTHSGWNSTIESIINGVTMICWPFFAEQQTNCWYCSELGIAMEIDNNVKREKVEKQVKELMDEDKGREMKRRAKKWKMLAYEAVIHNKGNDKNSWSNFDKVIDDVLLSPQKI